MTAADSSGYKTHIENLSGSNINFSTAEQLLNGKDVSSLKVNKEKIELDFSGEDKEISNKYHELFSRLELNIESKPKKDKNELKIVNEFDQIKEQDVKQFDKSIVEKFKNMVKESIEQKKNISLHRRQEKEAPRKRIDVLSEAQ